MHQTVHTAKINKSAEVDDGRHDATPDLAFLQLSKEILADLRLCLLQPGAARQHHVVTVLVQLDDLGLELHADIRLQVTDPPHLHQRSGQEAPQTDVDDQSAFDDLDDLAGDNPVLLLDLLDRPPGALVLGALLGENEAAFLVLLLLDERLDFVANADYLERVDVMLDRELFGRDDPFCLVADIEKNLVSVHLDNGAGDDVAVIEVLDGLVDGLKEGFG